eukprot:1482753-Rhodomonas_salina.1
MPEVRFRCQSGLQGSAEFLRGSVDVVVGPDGADDHDLGLQEFHTRSPIWVRNQSGARSADAVNLRRGDRRCPWGGILRTRLWNLLEARVFASCLRRGCCGRCQALQTRAAGSPNEP